MDKAKEMRKKRFLCQCKCNMDLYKKKYLYYTKKHTQTRQIKVCGKIGALEDRKEFLEWIKGLYTKKWITYCEGRFEGQRR